MCADWNREQAQELIELYRERPELWNQQHKDYNVRPLRQNAWHEIADKMECDVDTVKSKMASLLSSFRREKAKMKARGEKSHQVTWFAYKYFNFLLDRQKTNDDTVQVDEEALSGEAEIVNLKQLFDDCDYQAENPIEIKTECHSSAPKNDEFHHLPRKRARISYHDDVAETSERDRKALIKEECSTFAEHLEVKLKKFDDRLRVMVMHRINGIIYEAEMEKYNEDSS